MAEEPKHEDTGAQGNEQKDNRGGDFEKSSRIAFLTRFGEISALFAVVGAAVFVGGLLALWTSISANTGSSSVAWQVVAIVPRTVVAGYGLRLMVDAAFNVLYLVIALGSLLIFGWAFYFSYLWTHRKPGHPWIRWLLFMPALLLATALFLSFREWVDVHMAPYFAGLLGSQDSDEKIGANVYIGIILNVVGVVVAILAMIGSVEMKEGASDPDAAPERAFLPKAVNWRRILKGFVIFFIFAFGTAITNAASTKPPLPTVEVLGTDSAQQSTEGLLVSHSEGFWYVLDQKKDVVAIPDDGVDKVRMH